MTQSDIALKDLRKKCLTLLNAGNAEEALPVLQRILLHFPEDTDALDHLATAHIMLGQFEEADQVFQKCFAIGVEFPETLSNAARNANFWGKPELQLRYARRMLVRESSLRLEGLRHCIDALRQLGRAKEAWVASQQLLLEYPQDPKTRQQLVRILIECGEAGHAHQLCTELLNEDKDNISARLSLVETTILLGDLAHGLALAERLVEEKPAMFDAMSALGFHYQFIADMSAREKLVRTRKFAKAISRDHTPFSNWFNSLQPDRKLRIGLLSGDLRHHPVIYFLRSVLESLQDSTLEFIAYDTLVRHDEYTAKLRPLFTLWRDVKHLSDNDLADIIHSDKIDILLDLSGFTTGGRLGVFALKPAPLQASWLGFLGTTGLDTMDYVLADAISVPPGTELEFSETVWRLSNSPHCFTIPDEMIAVQPPPVLKNGFITFGCLNKPDKINDRVLALWSQLLAQIPNSRLHLRGNQFSLSEYRDLFRKRLYSHGIDPKRVRLDVAVPRSQYLEAYHQIDIALDPFPYNGGTTTAEALWMGVPLLTLSGDRMMARIGHSFLRTCGMEDWVASSHEEFVALALRKATNTTSLVELREKQRARLQETALFDAQIFSQDFEKAMREMWCLYVNRPQS